MSVSALNLIYQKLVLQTPKLEAPTYTYTGSGTIWSCILIFDNKTIISGVFTNKKDAKEDAAKKYIEVFQPQTEETTDLSHVKNTIFLLDGDQRMDCWKWLSQQTMDPSVIVYAFCSPVTPIPNGIYNGHFDVFKSKTTNRDSSDALLLMSLGRMTDRYGKSGNTRLVVVSSDHILVQAAQDIGIEWAGNLPQLTTLINTWK
uniref:DRBM domain-containing protein n=1 Tax=viral metagenome TaxID=1070528 RepID=A0A6C0JSZ8_9ZZZZ